VKWLINQDGEIGVLINFHQGGDELQKARLLLWTGCPASLQDKRCGLPWNQKISLMCSLVWKHVWNCSISCLRPRDNVVQFLIFEMTAKRAVACLMKNRKISSILKPRQRNEWLTFNSTNSWNLPANVRSSEVSALKINYGFVKARTWRTFIEKLSGPAGISGWTRPIFRRRRWAWNRVTMLRYLKLGQ